MPDEIPDDIREKARELVALLDAETIESDNQGYGLVAPDEAVEIVAIALMAEREACAKIVEDRRIGFADQDAELNEVASAIRRGTPHA